ncbi:hypothetical protein Gorai_009240 [Gossypium raimondii]|uniref:Uncharacterized protein n=1 Tax=Gossypium raimondii TaxID=29730 RepID=A0A7J8PT12_GOSRA|nr:hypothetical protein [Gossypium raimondii]
MDLVVSVMLQAALTSGVAFGLVNPTLGCLADKCNLSKFSTFGIFVVSGKNLALFLSSHELHPIFYTVLFKDNIANSTSTSGVCYRFEF